MMDLAHPAADARPPAVMSTIVPQTRHMYVKGASVDVLSNTVRRFRRKTSVLLARFDAFLEIAWIPLSNALSLLRVSLTNRSDVSMEPVRQLPRHARLRTRVRAMSLIDARMGCVQKILPPALSSLRDVLEIFSLNVPHLDSVSQTSPTASTPRFGRRDAIQVSSAGTESVSRLFTIAPHSLGAHRAVRTDVVMGAVSQMLLSAPRHRVI
mmetsp:Transcript_30878/g.49500  ORF Transcript_30878/g.49500 Transcript_30878/m.49500 type:complete len:210 (+) Transcript_30878:2720-3349(+)